MEPKKEQPKRRTYWYIHCHAENGPEYSVEECGPAQAWAYDNYWEAWAACLKCRGKHWASKEVRKLRKWSP